MNFIKKIAADLLFKKIGPTGASYRTLKKEYALSSEFVYKNKMPELLKYCYDNVPYYRQILIEQGIKNSEEITLDSISLLPLLTKEIIQRNANDLKSSDITHIKHNTNTSGGSTGSPVEFLQDEPFNVSTRSIKVIMDENVGYTVGQKKMLLWGSERDLFYGKEPLQVRVMKAIKNERWFNSFMMDDRQFAACIEWIETHSPQMILAYVESIYEVSRFINSSRQPITNVNVIMTTAGTLTEAFKEEIQRAFPNAELINRYGSREVGDVACTCSQLDAMVVSHMTQYVEVLDENGKHVNEGEIGEVVVTNLINRVMPLVRYRIGDMAIYGGEIEGKVLLKSVIGRTSDIFINDKNQKIHGEYFTHLFYGLDWVAKFQVRQVSTKKIIVKIVSSEHSRYKSELNEIVNKIKLVMGEHCVVELDFVDHIESTASGKYRYTISEVS
ncbi:phenylacetate--CoA ligase family protein [Vibrio sp. 10N.222.51.C12]|uniref:phenylacetate--CoA ligase family protein n=1 Tax=Vibrio sp. 10N.222.51.C12 TaxID=3229622 RepID=UPI003552615D